MRPLVRSLRPLACLALAFAGLSADGSAQLVGGEWENVRLLSSQAWNEAFGEAIADAGDVDGDGVADLIVGAPEARPNSGAMRGSAFLHSGANGTLLMRLDGQSIFEFFGRSVDGAGDVDADGVPDVIVGAPGASPGGVNGAGLARVHSGASGALLFSIPGTTPGGNLGWSVCGIGDVDGDGHADVLAGAPLASPGGLTEAGSALLVSGANGSLLRQFDGTSAGDRLGSSVSDAGDVDGDGIPDMLIGADHASPGGVGQAGSVFLLSGGTGLMLHRFDGQAGSAHFGCSVSDAGDVDADGVPDVVIGARDAAPAGMPWAGSAFVYSGATASLLWRFDGLNQGDALGYSISGGSDVDADGHDDLVLGAPYAWTGNFPTAGAAYVHSGATGARLLSVRGPGDGSFLGAAVEAVGDLDGDGIADIAVGSSEPSSLFGTGYGRVAVLAVDPYLHLDREQVSAAAGGSVQFELAFPASEAGASYALLASLAGSGPVTAYGLVVPLSPDPLLLSCAAGNAPAVMGQAYGALSAAATASPTLHVSPAFAALAGSTLHFAAVTFDTSPRAGRLSSIARKVVVTP